MGWFAASGTLGLALEYFLKTTAVLCLALLAAAASRRRPAAFRHFVLSLALIGLLLLPLLTLVPIGWRTALLPARPAEARNQEPIGQMAHSAGAASDSAEITPALSLPGPIEIGPGGKPAGTDVLSGEPSSALPARPWPYPSPADPLTVRTNPASRDILGLGLAAIWSAGLLVLLGRMAVGMAVAFKLTARSRVLPDLPWRAILERFLAFARLRRKVRLKSHPQVLVPMTWGWRKPVVLMPAEAGLWTEEERSSALFHELSHIKRADFLVTLAVRASLAVFWWNPLCWIVFSQLRKEQEIACDELVLRAGIKPSAYAASLLAFRRSAGFHWSPTAALLGMSGSSSFSERLAVILKQKLTFKEVKMRTRIMLAAAVILAVVFVGTARPTVVQAAPSAAAAREMAEPAVDAQEKQAETSGAAEKDKQKAEPAEKAQAEEKAETEKADKEKEVVKKKIVIETKAGAEVPIEVVITEGQATKKLILEKPLTIALGEEGKTLVLTSEGQELQILKGKPLRLEIKSGALKVLKEGKRLKLGTGSWTITREEGPGGGRTITVIEPQEAVKVAVGQKAEPGKSVHTWVVEGSESEPIVVSTSGLKDVLEKVRHLREQVEAVKAKKMDIASLEESVKKLEAELQEKEPKTRKIAIKLDNTTGNSAGAKRIGPVVAKVITEDKGAIQIIYVEKGRSSQDYERVAARLKKELPEGYRLEDSGFDPGSGTMRFKIAPPQGAKAEESLIHKLIESLKDELKSAK